MITYYGDFAEDDTVLIPFNTFSSDDPSASVTITNLADADIMVHKDAGLTQIATDGATVVIDFDSITGNHMITIDTSAHADYSTGSEYAVRIEGTTVDGGTINAWIGSFSIERAGGALAVALLMQADLDILTGSDGATLATAQGNYAPAKAGDSMDVLSISGDSVAADNLEAQYDGTGLTGDNFPATQTQVGNLSTGSAAISTAADSATITVGTETLTYASTVSLDGIYHEIADSGGQIDFYYEFDVGGSGVAVSVTMNGRMTGNGDDLDVFAYNWVTPGWEQVFALAGSNSTADVEATINLLSAHTGTGANLGKVQVRGFTASGLTSAVLYLDRVYLSYSIVSQSTGYALGRVWVNTVSGTAGTEKGVNGIFENPVNNIADAVNLAAQLNAQDFNISSDSTITLAANLQGYNVYGIGYTLDFAGFDCSGSHFFHASPVDGTVLSGGADHIDILDSIINDVTVGDSHFTNCSMAGTITLGSVASTLRVIDSRSVIAGSSTPIIDCGTAVGINHNITIADWQNGIEIRNLNNQGTDLFSMSGTGQVVFAASCSGNVNLRGSWKVTNNGTVTITYDDNTQNLIDVLVDTGTTLPATLIDIQGATFDTATDSLEAIRNRGDVSWITGGGGGITDIVNIQPLLPPDIDLADTATYRLGLMLFNSLDDLPSTAEITPGTISIDRKAIGGTSWSAIVTNAACLESAGLIYYDEVFDSGTGYAEGDSIRVTFKSQKVTVSANDYEISDATGRIFYSTIRQTMRGTDGANTTQDGIPKNAIFNNFEFPMVLTSDHYTAATAKTVTGAKSIDGAAFAAVVGTIAEVGSGVYQCDFTAADTNGDVITYKFSATDSDDTIVTVTTRA